MASKARVLGNKRHQERGLFKQGYIESKDGGRSVPESRSKVTAHTEVPTTQIQSIPKSVPWKA